MQLFVLVRKSFALSSRSARRRSFRLSGGHAGGDPPVPIPNTAVKPSRADDTATARLWESRTLPESFWGSLPGFPFFFVPSPPPPSLVCPEIFHKLLGFFPQDLTRVRTSEDKTIVFKKFRKELSGESQPMKRSSAKEFRRKNVSLR